MLQSAVPGLGAAGLEDRAGHPAVALIVHGVGALEPGEAAVLRLERRLQVCRVVNRMGIRVARQQLEALRETLREIEGQRIV